MGAALEGEVDHRSDPLPGTGAAPGEEDGGELLADAGNEATAYGGGSVVDDADAGRAPLLQDFFERGDGPGGHFGSPSSRKVSQERARCRTVSSARSAT